MTEMHRVEKEGSNLEVLTGPEGESAGIGDFLSPAKIPVTTIKKNLEAFTEKFGNILSNIDTIGDYKLSEVTININVTAGGAIQLIGIASGTTQLTGGITLKFKKN